MRRITVDGRWRLEPLGQPWAVWAPESLDGTGLAPEATVLFLADCLSFDHEFPTGIRPHAGSRAAERPPVEPLVHASHPRAGLDYYDTLWEAFGAAQSARMGSGVYLRYDTDDERSLTDYSTRFASTRAALALYAMALRQVDWLSEYLCLYRVLETTGRHGRPGIVEGLDRLGTHDFGRLLAYGPEPDDPPVDVFGRYQQRALHRVAELRSAGNDNGGIAKRLWEIRTQIAHGAYNTLNSHNATDVVSVGADLPVVRLLARAVVDDGATRRGARGA
jgi:hypothetical protein